MSPARQRAAGLLFVVILAAVSGAFFYANAVANRDARRDAEILSSIEP